MALVDNDDIQVHLPVDKFHLDDVPDSISEVILDLERIIKGRLSNIYSPTTLASWSTPETSPEYIRAIGGRLAAALIYRLRLAEDYPEESDYALGKYKEGMMMLDMVATGVVALLDVDEIVDTGGHLSANNYVTLPDPKFAMDREF